MKLRLNNLFANFLALVKRHVCVSKAVVFNCMHMQVVLMHMPSFYLSLSSHCIATFCTSLLFDCSCNVFVYVATYYHSLYMGEVSAGQTLITADAVYSLDSDICIRCVAIIILGKICLLQ